MDNGMGKFERFNIIMSKAEKQKIALLDGKTSVREINLISEIKEKVLQNLKSEDTKKKWLEWFDLENPIDIKAVQAKRIELENQDQIWKNQTLKIDDSVIEKKELFVEELPNLILADPPWRYNFSKSDSRQIENQYPSATVSEIIEHKPKTQPDCVCFMWATVAKLKEALNVLDGWGFEYKTHAIWNKGKIGMGYWFRGQHELLLVGTKGKMSPPEQFNRVSSIFEETRKGHSQKPECVYQWIEKAFPLHNKKEMYCRSKRKGWNAWGNEC